MSSHSHRQPADWAAVQAGLRPADFYGPGLPCQPTDAPPGSPAKIQLLAERYARRQQLHHPDDAQLSDRQGIAVAGDTYQNRSPARLGLVDLTHEGPKEVA